MTITSPNNYDVTAMVAANLVQQHPYWLYKHLPLVLDFLTNIMSRAHGNARLTEQMEPTINM